MVWTYATYGTPLASIEGFSLQNLEYRAITGCARYKRLAFECAIHGSGRLSVIYWAASAPARIERYAIDMMSRRSLLQTQFVTRQMAAHSARNGVLRKTRCFRALSSTLSCFSAVVVFLLRRLWQAVFVDTCIWARCATFDLKNWKILSRDDLAGLLVRDSGSVNFDRPPTEFDWTDVIKLAQRKRDCSPWH